MSRSQEKVRGFLSPFQAGEVPVSCPCGRVGHPVCVYSGFSGRVFLSSRVDRKMADGKSLKSFRSIWRQFVPVHEYGSQRTTGFRLPPLGRHLRSVRLPVYP